MQQKADEMDGAAKRFFFKCPDFYRLFDWMLRYSIHGAIPGNGRATGLFDTGFLLMQDDFRPGGTLSRLRYHAYPLPGLRLKSMIQDLFVSLFFL